MRSPIPVILGPLAPAEPGPLGELLPGEFAIRLYERRNSFVSGLYDKYSGTGTVITSATTLGPTEKFKLTAYAPGYALIQSDGHYVTAMPGGGLSLSQSIVENSLFTLKGPMQGEGGLFYIITRNGQSV
jgi:hypothetical protein